MTAATRVRIAGAGAVTGTPAMFPAAVETPNALVVAYSTVPDGWPGGAVHVTRSLDGGRSWTGPAVAAAPHDGEDAVLGAVGLARRADGALLLPVNAVTWTEGEGTAGRRLRLRLLRSADEGVTWTHDEPVDVDFAWPAVYGRIVEHRGDLLWPVWGKLREGERWRSALLASTDGGDTWAVRGTIGYDPAARLVGEYVDSGNSARGDDVEEIFDPEFRPHDPTDGFTETAVVELADGRLLAVLRQQGVGGDATLAFFRAVSADGGATWSAVERIGFSGMSPDLLRFADGTLLLVSRRWAPEGSDVQPGVEARIGSPDGLTWGDPCLLEDPHGTRLTSEYQCGYPAIVAEGDDAARVFFYSFLPEGGGRYVAWNLLRHDGEGPDATADHSDVSAGGTQSLHK
ncbi:sialidase family protein [Agromyces silvae]|uniref:sialidase family protein n=1 Tax=Agromyces silvae TaxID=3388266 RepID=UPI00280AE477|nr:sialidase family protein [Agromyces protaetiae]